MKTCQNIYTQVSIVYEYGSSKTVYDRTRCDRFEKAKTKISLRQRAFSVTKQYAFRKSQSKYEVIFKSRRSESNTTCRLKYIFAPHSILRTRCYNKQLVITLRWQQSASFRLDGQYSSRSSTARLPRTFRQYYCILSMMLRFKMLCLKLKKPLPFQFDTTSIVLLITPVLFPFTFQSS